MLSFTPQTDAERPLRILCLGAHSDDIEIGCGGTVLDLLAQQPTAHVHWIVFSSGGPREDEARRSAGLFLGGGSGHRITVHDFRNGYFPSVATGIKDFFESLKADPAPDIIFTHFREDRHQDHRVLSDLTWNTFRNHCILEYEIPKYDDDISAPNCFVALSEETCKQKCDYLMEVFATQRDKHWFDPLTFMGLMRLRGVEACSPSGFAEGFYARKVAISFAEGASQ